MATWNKAREAHEKSLKQGGPKTTSYTPAVYPTADGATCRQCGYVIHAKTCPTLTPKEPERVYHDEAKWFRDKPPALKHEWLKGPPYAPGDGCDCHEHFKIGSYRLPSCPMKMQTVERAAQHVADGRVFGNTQWWVCDRAWSSLWEEVSHSVRIGDARGMLFRHTDKLAIATALGQVMIARISGRQKDADTQRRMMQPPHRQSSSAWLPATFNETMSKMKAEKAGYDALSANILESLKWEYDSTARELDHATEHLLPVQHLLERAFKLSAAILAQEERAGLRPQMEPDVNFTYHELRNGLASARELDRNAGYELAASDYKMKWPAQHAELSKQLTSGQIGHFVSNPMNKTRAEQCMKRMGVPVRAGGKLGCVYAANDAGSISVWDRVTKTWNTSAAWPRLESAVSYKLCDWPEGSRPR